MTDSIEQISGALTTVVRPCFNAVQAKRSGKQSFLAAYIEHRLDEIGYAVKDVAEAAGVTRQFLYAVLRGTMLVPDTLLLKLANVTDISYAELVTAHAVDMLETAEVAA